MKSFVSCKAERNATRIFLAFIVCFLTVGPWQTLAVTLAWDQAVPLEGQTITGTEILLDGAVIGLTDQEQLTIDDSAWEPGDYTFTARHVGTRCLYDDPDNPETSPITCGVADVSEETEPLIYTVADTGVPGVAPLLRFPKLDRTSERVA